VLQTNAPIKSVVGYFIPPVHITLSLPGGEQKRRKSNGRTIWIVDAHRGDGRRFIVQADEKLSAFVELEREALTVTFYLESIRADS